jgi:hypothetical protein
MAVFFSGRRMASRESGSPEQRMYSTWSPLLGGGGHPLSSGGFSAAGAALQDENGVCLRRVDELIVQGIKSRRGIRT